MKDKSFNTTHSKRGYSTSGSTKSGVRYGIDIPLQRHAFASSLIGSFVDVSICTFTHLIIKRVMIQTTNAKWLHGCLFQQQSVPRQYKKRCLRQENQHQPGNYVFRSRSLIRINSLNLFDSHPKVLSSCHSFLSVTFSVVHSPVTQLLQRKQTSSTPILSHIPTRPQLSSLHPEFRNLWPSDLEFRNPAPLKTPLKKISSDGDSQLGARSLPTTTEFNLPALLPFIADSHDYSCVHYTSPFTFYHKPSCSAVDSALRLRMLSALPSNSRSVPFSMQRNLSQGKTFHFMVLQWE